MNNQLYLEWCVKAALNSEQLATEARLLFHAKHFARAYYLSHMSIEESSKSILLHSIYVQDAIFDLNKVNKLLRDHKKKIELIVMYAEHESIEFKTELKDLKKELISHINKLKNNSMYVSCENGLITSPDDTVSNINISVNLNVTDYLVRLANYLLTHL